MTNDVVIELEEDPSPIVKIIGATLRRSARDKGLRSKMSGLKGTFGLRSKFDPQAVTITFASGRIVVVSGVVGDPDVVVSVDLNNMSGPGADKPKVQGALKHPAFALAVGKLLEPPTGTWQEEAARFWEFAKTAKFAPTGLKVVNTDDRSSVSFGSGQLFEIHAPAHELMKVFTGNAVFAQELLEGKLHAIGDLGQAASLTGRTIGLMLGEDLE